MKNNSPVQWIMPAWAAQLLMETLQMDSRSGSFDAALRQEISAALETVEQTDAPSPALT